MMSTSLSRLVHVQGVVQWQGMVWEGIMRDPVKISREDVITDQDDVHQSVQVGTLCQGNIFEGGRVWSDFAQ